MKKDFKQFLEQLSETNATLDYYVNFDKIILHVDKIKMKLHQLNYLIGQDDLKTAVDDLFQENPNTFSALGILIATRKKDKKKTINKDNEVVLVHSYFATATLVYEFIVETGLAEIFRNKYIANLVDYVFGVEVGLDTHARKNRGGDQMENAISKIFQKNEITFQREIKHTEFSSLVGLGTDVKKFDFVVQTEAKTYLIETNYYNSGGSKLNEVARAYTDVAAKINRNHKFEFVWITDGRGWLTAKNKLEEAYHSIPKVYNLTTLKEFIVLVKSEKQ